MSMRWAVALLLCAGLATAGDKEAIEAARRVLEDALTKAPGDPDEVKTAIAALNTLHKLDKNGLAGWSLKLAEDATQDPWLRAKAVAVASLLPDARDEARGIALRIVRNRKAPNILRHKTIFTFKEKAFANDDARKALEEVLLRPDDDGIVQRSCLYALSETAPLKKIRELLLRKELYAHKYFGIRIDVCTGLAALNVRDRPALEILIGLLEDEDKDDKTFMVPQEAWLSLWVLTGKTYGVKSETFAKVPAPLDQRLARVYLWKPSQIRRGVTFPMVQEVAGMLCTNYDAAMRDRRIARIRNKDAAKKAAAEARADLPAR